MQIFWRTCRRYLETWDSKKMWEEELQQLREAEGPAAAEAAAKAAAEQEGQPTLAEDLGEWSGEEWVLAVNAALSALQCFT